MNKVLVIVGIAIIAIGIVLAGTFPWAFYKSARDLKSDDYDVGDKVTVYGTITDVKYSELINKTSVELDGNLTVIFDGNFKEYKTGDYVFLTIEKKNLIQFGNWKVSYWTSTPKDVHSVSSMELYFYILSGVGVVIVILGVILQRVR